ncbi:MAG: DUF167 domain-containing protein [Nanoarchaeota archaeon]|nr:DUF167 domain-containing protein [Nanoarchaeota archaeon]
MKIQIKTIPNSSLSKLEKISNNEYKAHVKSPPENNKANIELINLLAKELKIPPKSIKIKNPYSKNKIIELK